MAKEPKGFSGARAWGMADFVYCDRPDRCAVAHHTKPSGIANSRPDFVGGNPVLQNDGTTRLYLNKAAFAMVPTYASTGATVRPGNENPSQVHGPGLVTVNASLGKTFAIRERMRLEVRGDWLNAFNHVNYNNPNATLTSPLFGVLPTDVGPRTGQLNARFTF